MYKQIDSNKRKTAFLMVIFSVFIIFIGWLYSQLAEDGYAGLSMAVIISLGMTATSYFSGDKIALASAGAKLISKEDNPYVYRLVENLCITAGLPIPKVHIIPDSSINAFATGRNPEHASIAITQGAIEKLANEELEGVIAHELSHIKNYDIRLMMVVLVLVGIIAMISDWLLRSNLSRSSNSNNRNNQSSVVLLVIGIILAILSPLISQIIQLAVSRKREYLADADGSLLTRYPEGLANALEKISRENIEPMQRANNATAHLFIASPFGQTKKFLTNLFSTHPPIEERISLLRNMTA